MQSARSLSPWKLAIIAAFAVAAMAWRLAAPALGGVLGLELITATTFLGATLLRSRWAVIVPVLTVAVSDALLGNPILLVTWSAWAIIGLGSLLVRRRGSGLGRLHLSVGFAVGATMFFYLWTNAGFWLQWPEMYGSGVSGLLASYVAGLPFLRNQLLGNLVLVPLAAGVAKRVLRSGTVSRRPSPALTRSCGSARCRRLCAG